MVLVVLAQFTVAKIWNQSKCPPMDDWIKWMRTLYLHYGMLFIHKGMKYNLLQQNECKWKPLSFVKLKSQEDKYVFPDLWWLIYRVQKMVWSIWMKSTFWELIIVYNLYSYSWGTVAFFSICYLLNFLPNGGLSLWLLREQKVNDLTNEKKKGSIYSITYHLVFNCIYYWLTFRCKSCKVQKQLLIATTMKHLINAQT